MFEFLIDDLDGNTHTCTLEDVVRLYPDDDVIYIKSNAPFMANIPCRLSSARPVPAICPECDSDVAVCMMGHYCGEKG